MKYIANTRRQSLALHLSCVGVLAWELAKQSGVTNEKLLGAIYASGCLHDIGKIDPNFQHFLHKGKVDSVGDGVHLDVPRKKRFSFNDYPRHNEISLMLIDILRSASKGRIGKNNRAYSEYVSHAVYWHHAQPIRSSGKLSSMEGVAKVFKDEVGNQWGTLLDDLSMLLGELKTLGDDLGAPTAYLPSLSAEDVEDELEDPVAHRERFPAYKFYKECDTVESFADQCEENAKRSLIRVFVNTADNIISAISADELSVLNAKDTARRHVVAQNKGLHDAISSMEDGFERRFPGSERNKTQSDVASQLNRSEELSVLAGAAGCGKTKIGLSWAKAFKQSVFWVCPRISVCQGLFSELKSDEYLPDSQIEICTGEIKQTFTPDGEYETPAEDGLCSDVNVITIDQVSSSLTTHRGVPLLFKLINSTLLFDEYHELIISEGFNLFLKELMCIKALCNKQDMLLVSATPNLFFTEHFLGVYRGDIVQCPSFNKQGYRFTFPEFRPGGDDDPFSVPRTNRTLVVTNTAKEAQTSYMRNLNKEASLLCHSKYSSSDKQWVFDQVMANFGKNAKSSFDVLRSSPVVQAALNISVEQLVTEITSAENWCQRLGRLDRFGEGLMNLMETPVPSNIASLLKGSTSCATSRFLSAMHQRESAFAWVRFVRERLGGGDLYTLADVYECYRDFYQDKNCQRALENDLLKTLNASAKRIDAMNYAPVQFPKNKREKEEGRVGRMTLRGANCYVKVAVVDIDDSLTRDVSALRYLPEPVTLSKEAVKGFGDKRKDLIAFMQKKLHQIESTSTYKENYGGKYVVDRESMLLDKARSLASPIYASYTVHDLERLNAKGPDDAVYYVNGRQPIGLMSLSTLGEMRINIK